MFVLVIALNSDLHADSVVFHLNRMGINIMRIDPTIDDSIPTQMTIFPDFQSIFEFMDNKNINMADCGSIFCRFAVESLDATTSDPLEYFSSSESLASFLASLRIIDSHYWINDPWVESRIDCKILQAKYATTVGLNIPKFIVSSNYKEIESFTKLYKDTIIKPLTDKSIALIDNKFVGQEDINTNNFYAPYTAKFKHLSKNKLQSISDTPTFLQEQILKKCDIRTTIIDDNVFSAAMPYDKNTPIDFRLQKEIEINKIDLPREINIKLIKLVNKLGLRFASCDLILDKNNEIYFIEANAQGNWLWTEQGANLPISETLAKALISKRR